MTRKLEPDLEEFASAEPPRSRGTALGTDDLAAVFDVPVHVSAVLGGTRLSVGELLQLGEGSVLDLDRKVGDPIDVFVNDRLVARGEIVIVDNRLGVTMTEILSGDD
jgi:flagellar motor switch protein FliN/FliY